MFYSQCFTSFPFCVPSHAGQSNHGTQPIKDQPHHLDVQRATLAPFLFASTHSVTLFFTKSMLPSSGFTSTGVQKHLHTPTVASRLQDQPYGRLPVRRPFKPLLHPPPLPPSPHSSPHVYPYKRLYHLNHLLLTGQLTKRN